MIVLNGIIDRASDSNPQIFRELKERLTLRNVGIAIAATVVIQILILLYFNGQIPVPTYDYYPVKKLANTYNQYCLVPQSKTYYSSTCQLNEFGSFNINWQKWWSHVFGCTSWMLSLGLILGSTYLLVADLVREEKRGTLNFIRLSPQPTNKIFSGKIIGVPILVYLATSLAVPLHLWAGFNAGANLSLMAGWYAAVVSIWWLLASASGLYVLLGGVQAIVTTMAVAYPVCLPLSALNWYVSTAIDPDPYFVKQAGSILWFGLPVTSNALWFDGLIAAVCAISSYGIWQALDRRYLNPTATVLGKYQSYLFNLCVQIGIAGFAIPIVCALDNNKYYYNRSMLIGLAAGDFIALLVLIPLLLPNKQTLQDWSRHRRERTQNRKSWKRNLLQDLIGNDKSPALLAIAINIGMAVLLWSPIAVAFARISDNRSLSMAQPTSLGLKLLGFVCLAASLILIYATIAHLGLFLKVKKRNLWTIAIVGGAALLPLVVAYVLSPVKTPTGFAAIVLLFSPFAPIGIASLTSGTIFAAFAAQLGMLGILTRNLQRKLQLSGRSQTQELLTQN